MISEAVEEEIKNQKAKSGRKSRKKVKLDPNDAAAEIKIQNIHADVQGEESDQSDYSHRWSSEVIEPALKTMNFRKKRGTRMKELLKGKPPKDNFWQKYQNYFGGKLDRPDDSEDQEDYEASSSGRDQFDSDFDLTDSYVGKRGRKKGSVVKRRKKAVPKSQEHHAEGQPKVKAKRGRKRKVPANAIALQQPEILLKEGKPFYIEEVKKVKEEPIPIALSQPRQTLKEADPHQAEEGIQNPDLPVEQEIVESKIKKEEANVEEAEQDPMFMINKEEELEFLNGM